MKFKVTFKTPDAVTDAVKEAAEQEVSEIVDAEERSIQQSELAEQLSDFASTWVKYEEYITVEFDTEKGTATVVPQ